MFVPKVNDWVTITLPAEKMRALVTRVVDRHTIIARIGQPFMKSHNFRKDDLVGCRRKQGELGEFWEAIETRAPALEVEPLPQREKNPEKSTIDAQETVSNAPNSAKLTLSKRKGANGADRKAAAAKA